LLVAVRHRELRRRRRFADEALAQHLLLRPPGVSGSEQGCDPFVVTFWPFAQANRFQSLLYSQGRQYGAAALPVAAFEEMAAVPREGLSICHFHWLASVRTEEAFGSLRRVLARLKDQKKPIVWTVHNILPHDAADIDAAIRVRRLIVEAADLVHVMNERTAELVEPYFSLRDKPTFYSPHPSYLGDVPDTVTREEARLKLGIRPETTVFLCFGAIRAYKGIEDLVAAAERLRIERPDLDWVLLVAGIAKDKALVHRLGEVRSLGSRLRFLPGKVAGEDIQYFFKAADFSVCPYRRSLNSGAAMLSMSFGVPLIAPQIPAFAELLSKGTGIGYDPEQEDALTAALAGAIGNDTTEMRSRAVALADERRPEAASAQFFKGLTTGLPAVMRGI